MFFFYIRPTICLTPGLTPQLETTNEAFQNKIYQICAISTTSLWETVQLKKVKHKLVHYQNIRRKLTRVDWSLTQKLRSALQRHLVHGFAVFLPCSANSLKAQSTITFLHSRIGTTQFFLVTEFTTFFSNAFNIFQT